MIGLDTELELDVVSTFTTPDGRPASSNRRAVYMVVNGVILAGLTTTVQPAANAGAIFLVAMANGKFHGVIRKHGPTGCLDTSMAPLPSGVSP